MQGVFLIYSNTTYDYSYDVVGNNVRPLNTISVPSVKTWKLAVGVPHAGAGVKIKYARSPRTTKTPYYYLPATTFSLLQLAMWRFCIKVQLLLIPLAPALGMVLGPSAVIRSCPELHFPRLPYMSGWVLLVWVPCTTSSVSTYVPGWGHCYEGPLESLSILCQGPRSTSRSLSKETNSQPISFVILNPLTFSSHRKYCCCQWLLHHHIVLLLFLYQCRSIVGCYEDVTTWRRRQGYGAMIVTGMWINRWAVSSVVVNNERKLQEVIKSLEEGKPPSAPIYVSHRYTNSAPYTKLLA